MFELIQLPYKSLAPVISDQTLSFHHGKHLQTYVDNLNKLIAGTELEGKTLEEIVVISSGAEKSPAIFNNAGQILNHNLYFSQFRFPSVIPSEASVSPGNLSALGQDDNSVIPSEASVSPLMAQIEKQWGSLDAFKAEFEAKGVSLFGSGWVWLAAKENGELVILQCPGADNPICHFERSPQGEAEKSLRPLLTFDVWEHAYYLDYQNRRAAHLQALWQIVNWEEIEKRYA